TKPISKSGEWDNAKRQLSYSLDINPEGADLVEGSDEITLTDAMHNWSNEVSEYLIQDSVKLYYADGTEVPASEWSWKVTSTDDGWGNHYHTLVVTLKDSTPYILEYSYQLTKSNEDNAVYYYPKNTATLEGVANGSDSTTTTVHWQRTGTSSGFDTEKAYVINKVDMNNYGLALEGATFTVYKYDGDLDDSNDEVIATYRTNAKGQISIVYSGGIYQEDIIYYAKETEAPVGYNLPDNPEKYYFYWDEDSSLSTLPIEIQQITNLSKNNGSTFVENEKIKTIDLTVNKEWFTADGDETSHSDGFITYDVIQVATAEGGTSTESTYLSGETLSHDDDWTKTYTELPVSGTDSSGNAVTYTYYVKENAVSGYDTSYTNSNNAVPTEEAADMAIASDSATITIRNTAQKQYDLPDTGGNGTQWHYIAGAVLSLLAIGLLIFKVYKRYQIGGHL
uniref:SpaA isopeptide-forming pilin-related protein n=1 Tax=uncultured Streptococcus sp. TaxID=83427 RepID=UPI0028EA5A6F